MAKPIEPTPVLEGKNAENFLEQTRIEESAVNPKKAKFLHECFDIYQKFKV
ncbi:MAG: hypothetical protein NTX79_08450 [Candidatus Micrarchaeota archaeon]|nr:hypothetical protein [Candidatus Micrarchaeota archaeon]